MLFFLVIARLTGGRITLLPMALSLIPMLGNEVLGWFLNRGDDQSETTVAQAYDRLSQRGQSFRSRMGSIGHPIDAPQSGGFSAQSAPQAGRDPLAPPNNAPFPSPRRPNLRGGRTPSRFGQIKVEVGEICRWMRGDSVRSPKGDDLLGPASLPGLRGRDLVDFDAPRRPRRDKRGREGWDDEVFGGMFDEDGDGIL